MVKEFDSLIFDMDGTLWDCSSASAEAFARAYEFLGLTTNVTAEDVRKISGLPPAEYEPILFGDTPKDKMPELLSKLDEFELEAVTTKGKDAVFPGVEEGLERLSKRYKLCLVSNCTLGYLEIFLKHSSIGHYFIDAECIGRTGNPKGENIKAVIERNNLQSSCYIGDTVTDESAANLAGIPFIHVEYGFGYAKNPMLSFGSFEELTEFFERF